MMNEEFPSRCIGLLPDAINRLSVTMRKKNIDSIPPGDKEWLDDIF